MVSTDTIIELVRIGFEGDKVALRNFVEALAAQSSNKNQQKLNKALKKVLADYSSNLSTSSATPQVVNDNPNTKAVWLGSDIAKRVEHFIAVQKDDTLPNELKSAYSRLMLYGPPGSGKTTLGYYIAEQLSLPLTYIKVSDVISSKFGETTRNIADIFQQPGRRVIFLDEFDAFGKSRYDSNDVGELKRIVNSLIQTLDFADDEKIVIGATNLVESIDPAILRRFNIKVHVDRLDRIETTEFFDFLLTAYPNMNAKLKVNEKKELLNIFSSLNINTVDAIRNIFEHTIINTHLDNKPSINIIDFYATLLTSGYLEKDRIQKLSRNEKTSYEKLMDALATRFNSLDISSYANIHRNSLMNYKKRIKDA